MALLAPRVLFSQQLSWPDPRHVAGCRFHPRIGGGYQAVQIGDLPGSEEGHDLIRSLIGNPTCRLKVDDIVVDFGNPLMQPMMDRYLLEGDLIRRRCSGEFGMTRHIRAPRQRRTSPPEQPFKGSHR